MGKPHGIATKLALAWTRGWAKRHPAPAFAPLAPDSRSRILIVNTTGIGDTIFCTAAIADLRQSFPHAHLALFVDRRREELVRHNPHLDGLVLYHGKYKKLRATLGALRDGAFDVAIIQHANDPDVVPMVAKAGIPALVGYASHTFSDLYAVKLPPADRAGGAHTIDARLNLTRAVGAAGMHWHTVLAISDDDLAAARAALKHRGLAEGEAVALNLGGSVASKRWPVERWHELAGRLTSAGMPCLLVGGPDEAGVARALAALKGVSSVVGELRFMQSAAALTLCRAHVSGDTGLMHAGLALDVPTVALFGPDDPKWTGPHPKQRHAVVVQAPESAMPAGYDRRRDAGGLLMQSISVEDVFSALSTLL